MTYYNLIQQFEMYRAARFYCFSCGFSITPLHHRSKAQLFRGGHFQTWFPCDQHLRKWFCNKNRYGLAIVPGEVSGNLVILDFDEPGSFDAWYKHTGIETPRVISRRGVHVYIRLQEMVKNGKGMFQDKIFGDIIAHGNITAPPSLHPSGHQYRWEGDPRNVPLFPCLASLNVTRLSPTGGNVDQKKPMPKKRLLNRQASKQIRNPRAYVRAAVIGEYQKIVDIGKGQRNNQLYQSALKLAKYIEMVPQSIIVEELRHAAINAGMTEHEDSIMPTIRSGLRHGIENGVLRRK